MILTKKIFDNLNNTSFEIAFNPENVSTCELIEIKSINSSTLTEGQTEPFSLVFETPGNSVFEQNSYLVKNAEMDEFTLFLVPIGADNKGVRYEAIFT